MGPELPLIVAEALENFTLPKLASGTKVGPEKASPGPPVSSMIQSADNRCALVPGGFRPILVTGFPLFTEIFTVNELLAGM